MRLELGHYLSRPDLITHIDRSLDHPAGNAKGQTRFVLRLDASGIRDCLADVAFHDGHRSDRSNLRRYRFGLRLAACQQSRGKPRKQEKPRSPSMVADQAA